MWTDTTRAIHARKGLALPSSLTDDEWVVLEPFLPLASHVGRPRKWTMRQVLDGMLYVLRGGLPWRMMPPDFRQRRRCNAISMRGGTVACSKRSTIICS